MAVLFSIPSGSALVYILIRCAVVPTFYFSHSDRCSLRTPEEPISQWPMVWTSFHMLTSHLSMLCGGKTCVIARVLGSVREAALAGGEALGAGGASIDEMGRSH